MGVSTSSTGRPLDDTTVGGLAPTVLAVSRAPPFRPRPPLPALAEVEAVEDGAEEEEEEEEGGTGGRTQSCNSDAHKSIGACSGQRLRDTISLRARKDG